MPKILFVCTGNTCRSPMAEFLLRQMLEGGEAREQWEVSSAGISAIGGNKASPQAIKVLQEEGVDPGSHQSRPLGLKMIEQADLIVTMTVDHKTVVETLAPWEKGKIFTLKELAGETAELDLADPFGQSKEVYRRTRDEIKLLLQGVIGKMNQFASKEGNLVSEENNYKRGDQLKIAIACDHAGLTLKKELIAYLERKGHYYQDVGTCSEQSVDYPDFAFQVASTVATGENDRGIVICGTGIGMSIAANKVKGIRAALCHDVFSAKASRQHNDSNILAIGSRVIGPGLDLEIVQTWLSEDFLGDRHKRRINKIDLIERGEYQGNEEGNCN